MSDIDWKSERDRIDLGQVATRLLGPAPGRKGERGRRLWWPCPFHQDSNPSFCVDPGKPWWKCHGCGERGDAAEALFSLLCIGGALVLDKFVHGMVDHYWSRGAIMAAWASAGMATRAYYVAMGRARAPSEDWPGLVMRGKP